MLGYYGEVVPLKEIENGIQDLALPQKIRALAIYKRYKIVRQILQKMEEQKKSIDKKYLNFDNPILEQISKIVQGKRDIDQNELKDLDRYLNKEEIQHVKEHLHARKIPDYWFTVLKNCQMVQYFIGNNDEPLLKAIENMSVVDEVGTDNFTIVFDFAPNDIINNQQLTKKYYVKNNIPIKCESSVIEWKGKNLTVKQVKKKQKNKKTGQQKVVHKTVQTKSFFSFFKNIQVSEGASLQHATKEQLKKSQELGDDYELGGILVDDVIPLSLEYFLGVKQEEGDQDEDSHKDQGNEDEESDEDEKKEMKKKSKPKSKEKSNSKGKGEQQTEKPKCQQQ